LSQFSPLLRERPCCDVRWLSRFDSNERGLPPTIQRIVITDSKCCVDFGRTATNVVALPARPGQLESHPPRDRFQRFGAKPMLMQAAT
jgi:hypothetical protein